MDNFVNSGVDNRTLALEIVTAVVQDMSRAAIKADALIIGQSSFACRFQIIVFTKAHAVIGPSA